MAILDAAVVGIEVVEEALVEGLIVIADCCCCDSCFIRGSMGIDVVSLLIVLANDGLVRGWGISGSLPKPNPVVDMHIWTVALLIRWNASRHASAGGHFSIKSSKTEVAARTVKSTSSRVWLLSALYI